MTTSTTFLCVAFAIVLAIVLFPTDVLGIWCFQCNSQFDENCEHIHPNDTSSHYYRQCSDDDQSRIHNGSKEFFCRKIVQRIYDREGLIRVVRRCGFVKHDRLPCYSFKNEGHEDIVCQCFTDACNSAPNSGTISPIWALTGASAVLLRSHFNIFK